MTLDCGHEPSEHSAISTGYGKDADGKTFCYECCADNDREQMTRDGKTTLYLSGLGGDVALFGETRSTLTNWPGSLVFSCYVKRGRHNMARVRYDVWFTGPDGKPWHGTQYGDNTQICHCKRLKTA